MPLSIYPLVYSFLAILCGCVSSFLLLHSISLYEHSTFNDGHLDFFLVQDIKNSAAE